MTMPVSISTPLNIYVIAARYRGRGVDKRQCRHICILHNWIGSRNGPCGTHGVRYSLHFWTKSMVHGALSAGTINSYPEFGINLWYDLWILFSVEGVRSEDFEWGFP